MSLKDAAAKEGRNMKAGAQDAYDRFMGVQPSGEYEEHSWTDWEALPSFGGATYETTVDQQPSDPGGDALADYGQWVDEQQAQTPDPMPEEPAPEPSQDDGPDMER